MISDQKNKEEHRRTGHSNIYDEIPKQQDKEYAYPRSGLEKNQVKTIGREGKRQRKYHVVKPKYVFLEYFMDFQLLL